MLTLRELNDSVAAARRMTGITHRVLTEQEQKDLSYANLCRLRMKRLWNERRGLPTTGLPPRIRKRRTAL